ADPAPPREGRRRNPDDDRAVDPLRGPPDQDLNRASRFPASRADNEAVMRVHAPRMAVIGTLVLAAACTAPSATLVSGLPKVTLLTLPRGWQMVDVATDPLAVNDPLNVGPEVLDAKVFSPDSNELAAGSI